MLSAREHILTMLNRLRRRLALVRLVEAAAMGGIVGGLSAAWVKAGWLLADLHRLGGLAVMLALLAAGVVLCLPAVRRRLHSQPVVAWVVAVQPIAWALLAGGLALACGTGAVGKNAWLAIAPAGAAIAAAAALLRLPSTDAAARLADRRGPFDDGLATACQLLAAPADAAFAQAVWAQTLHCARQNHVDKTRFWTLGRPAAGALALALLAALLMAPWSTASVVDPAVRQRWERAAVQAGRQIEDHLAQLSAGGPGAPAADAIARIRELAQKLSSAAPADPRQLQAQAVELDRLADALRRAVRDGKVDARTAEEIGRLIAVMEDSSRELAQAVSPSRAVAVAERQPEAVSPPVNPALSNPADWVYVYRPEVAPSGTDGGAGSTRAGAIDTPLDTAWAEACRRAESSLNRQDIPAEYRPILRAYFTQNR